MALLLRNHQGVQAFEPAQYAIPGEPLGQKWLK
jgi:hypothetical protein